MPKCNFIMTKQFMKVFIESVLVLIVFAAIFLVKKLWPPHERGMFCNDVSLHYPYKEEETISDTVLLFYGVVATILLILGIELFRIRSEKHMSIIRKKVTTWMITVYPIIGIFLFGCAVTQLSTVVIKRTLGTLRPYFIDVCKPDWNKTACYDAAAAADADADAYVQHIPCSTEDEDKLEDARTSFPSGHASFAAFTMVYLVIYLQKRLRLHWVCLLRPLLQLVCLMLVVFTGLSRISDYKHHWSDIAGGFLLGLLIALFLSFCVLDLYSGERTSDKKKKAAAGSREEEELNASPFMTA